MTPEEARVRAEEQGLDLVEVAPNAKPPVCRIMDYGKYKYEQKKKAAAGKSKGKGRAATLKEIERLKAEGPSEDDVARVKELERRDLETNAKQNSYWQGSMQTVHLYGWDAAGIARRSQRTERLTAENIKQMFQKYFSTERYTQVTLKPE